MAKKKRRTKSKKSTPRPQRPARLAPPSPKLLARLEEADRLTQRRQWAEALALLTELDRAYPNRIEVVGELGNLAYETNDWHAYQTHAERFVRLDPDNADVLLGLSGAYITNSFPWLALTTRQRFLQKFPDHPKAAEVEETLALLKTLLIDTVSESNLPEDIALDVLVLHDRMRAQLQNADLLGVRSTARQLLALTPTFIPALNNLSQAEFALGETDRGIELAEQVLAIEPDNFQALANLTHFQFVTGHPEQANETADRLLAVTSDDMDIWLKKAEALTYLDRNQDVLAVADAAEAAGFFAQAVVNPILYHYRGVAAARTGNTRLARQSWQMVLKIDPNFALAKENLADLKKPVGEREGAWPLTAGSWISKKTMDGLQQLFSRQEAKSHPKAVERETQRFLKRHPDILPVLPILLERSDPSIRRVALGLALEIDTPALRTAVSDFVTGPHGSDALRAQTAQKAVREGILPSGTVSMWLEGEQQELLLLGFTISEEPVGHLPKAAEAFFNPAMEALFAEDFERGAQLLEKAVKLAPNEPSILNNLAMAYERLDRAAESQAIQDRITAEFPDYLFGITARANLAILSDDFEEAHALLTSLLSREKLHITEYRALAEGFIRLFLAQEQVEGAERWMEMWEGVEDDHPAQDRLRLHISFLKAGTAGPFGKKSGWLTGLLGKSLKE